jgi:SAM-dependent methyltransferase
LKTNHGDSDRKRREREFHNRRFSQESREGASRFYSVLGASNAYYRELARSLARGKRVLEYGCGPGAVTPILAREAALVVAIDISDVAVETALRQTASQGAKNAAYCVMDAEWLGLADASFDAVCGRAILHHLNLERSFAEISRVLRDGGVAVFYEPLGHNPAIRLYRALTPEMRTPDEHPLRRRDFAVARKYFGRVEMRFFGLFSLCAVPFRRAPFFESLVRALDRVDRIVLRLPGLRWWAWTSVMVLSNPHPTGSSMA